MVIKNITISTMDRDIIIIIKKIEPNIKTTIISKIIKGITVVDITMVVTIMEAINTIMEGINTIMVEDIKIINNHFNREKEDLISMQNGKVNVTKKRLVSIMINERQQLMMNMSSSKSS